MYRRTGKAITQRHWLSHQHLSGHPPVAWITPTHTHWWADAWPWPRPHCWHCCKSAGSLMEQRWEEGASFNQFLNQWIIPPADSPYGLGFDCFCHFDLLQAKLRFYLEMLFAELRGVSNKTQLKSFDQMLWFASSLSWNGNISTTITSKCRISFLFSYSAVIWSDSPSSHLMPGFSWTQTLWRPHCPSGFCLIRIFADLICMIGLWLQKRRKPHVFTVYFRIQISTISISSFHHWG